jgi:hypothetical protein
MAAQLIFRMPRVRNVTWTASNQANWVVPDIQSRDEQEALPVKEKGDLA